MTLQNSGPIWLSQIQDEFRVGRGVTLASLYRGGGIVPNIPQNYGIPASGGIYLSHFYGATSYASASGSTASYNLGNATVPKTRVMSTIATASASGGNGSFSYNWRVIGSSGVTSPSAGSTSNQCAVQATATLNGGGYVDVACDISDGTSSQTVTARCNFNYFNTL